MAWHSGSMLLLLAPCKYGTAGAPCSYGLQAWLCHNSSGGSSYPKPRKNYRGGLWLSFPQQLP